jgi:hypothetical protein
MKCEARGHDADGGYVCVCVYLHRDGPAEGPAWSGAFHGMWLYLYPGRYDAPLITMASFSIEGYPSPHSRRFVPSLRFANPCLPTRHSSHSDPNDWLASIVTTYEAPQSPSLGYIAHH